MHKTLGVAVVTLNAEKHLPYCLPPLINSSLKPRVLVIDSSSHDNTAALARSYGAEVVVIPKREFNHGLTREKARLLLNTDIVAFFTQDAHPEEDALLHLVQPLIEGKAAASYSRQLPHRNAGFYEAFSRRYNYPETPHIRNLDMLNHYGIYTFFFSNSASAYLNLPLSQIGGFSRVLLGEDTVACAKLLRQGHSIAYAAGSIVRHSHSYSLIQEFKRSFDTGIARESYRELLSHSDTKRGREFSQALLLHTLKEKPHYFPYTFFHLASKWLGYKLGQLSPSSPAWFKRLFSSQPYYFNPLNH